MGCVRVLPDNSRNARVLGSSNDCKTKARFTSPEPQLPSLGSLQRRRAQIEGRVNILKNVFIGQPLRSKGFEHRKLAVTWTVLVHSLWVLARLQRAEAAPAQRQAA